MNTIRKSTIALALLLLSVPVTHAQDLSKYRIFSLGTSLSAIANQVSATPSDVTVVHQSPEVIQELTWWPIGSGEASGRPDAVQQIQFSFCDRQLYSIVATYEETATRGITDGDMVEAISATYGAATLPPAEAKAATSMSYSTVRVQLAVWENAQYLVTLSRSPISDLFQLTLSSKKLKGEADAAIAEAVKQESADAPGQEIARQKKAAADLEAQRQTNLKAFRP